MPYFGANKTLHPLRNRNKLSLRINTSLAQLYLTNTESYQISAGLSQDNERSPDFNNLPSPDMGLDEQATYAKRHPQSPVAEALDAAGLFSVTDEATEETAGSGKNGVDKLTPDAPALSSAQEQAIHCSPASVPVFLGPPPGLPHPPLYKKEVKTSSSDDALSPGPPPGLPHPPRYKGGSAGATDSHTLCSLDTPPPALPEGPSLPKLCSPYSDGIYDEDPSADDELSILRLQNPGAADVGRTAPNVQIWLRCLSRPENHLDWVDDFVFTPECSPSPSPVKDTFPLDEASASRASTPELSDDELLQELGIVRNWDLTPEGISKELGLNYVYKGTYEEFCASQGLPQPQVYDSSDRTSESSPYLVEGNVLFDQQPLQEDDYVRQGIAANISGMRAPPAVTFELDSPSNHTLSPVPSTIPYAPSNRVLLEIHSLPRDRHYMVVPQSTPPFPPPPMPIPSLVFLDGNFLDPADNLFTMPEDHARVKAGLMEAMRTRALRDEEAPTVTFTDHPNAG
ncbi:hypothetical protein FA13DRAFT_1396715 [Coprinellus micaceus]|uniref:Uncharacterized protein n=1 Tax=Coprinellus micaceus TaxID=71717 RepID=A0A4Y7SRR2_COPMI|nr:hypothetical protein FA13DRAFT_1396715 [Coprinellus micaceus]